ncbi:restriction endonuclease [Rhizobium ruizarguesonis]
MPTVLSMEVPKPKNWQDFETIVWSAMSQRWNSLDLQKNGRPGQVQHGVDIYGTDEVGRRVGIQCKRYKVVLSMKTIEEEVAAAEKFKSPLTTLYLATTGDFDSPLQSAVRQLSDNRVAAGKFAVSMLFWEEIVAGLLLNPIVFSSYYPQFSFPTSGPAKNERLLAALELGYYGGDLWQYVILTYGELGLMAQTDPDHFIATIQSLEHRARQLLSVDDAAPLITALESVRAGCVSEKQSKSDWDVTELHAKRVGTRINAARSILPTEEGRMLSLALQLSRIYHHSDDAPSKDLQKQVEQNALSFFAGKEIRLAKKFKAIRKLKYGYEWADRAFGSLAYELRWAG